tara:strand:+ start:214 stop:1089 length:876 start_codon:yes stop_codon:yes gene_type:complete
MILDVWTILNPILRTVVYILVLATIGSILFQFHFSKFFENDIAVYSNNLIKKFASAGFIVGLIVFLSVAGNLGGDLFSIFDLSLLKLSFETLSGKSAILLIVGFFLIITSVFFNNILSVFSKSFGILMILASFIIMGHSNLKGISTQVLVIIHLICISFWLGSFLPLRQMCLNKKFSSLIIVSEKFGVYAVFYISGLMFAGLIFSYILVGNINALISTSYGNILLIKLFFVFVILLIGALNKFRIVPYMKNNYDEGAKKLKTSIQIEMIVTSLILFFTSILTTTLPTPVGV